MRVTGDAREAPPRQDHLGGPSLPDDAREQQARGGLGHQAQRHERRGELGARLNEDEIAVQQQGQSDPDRQAVPSHVTHRRQIEGAHARHQPLAGPVRALRELIVDEGTQHRAAGCGADRVARLMFSLGDKSLAEGIHLNLIFDYSRSLFRRRGGQDIPICLTRAGGEGRFVGGPKASVALIGQPNVAARIHIRIAFHT